MEKIKEDEKNEKQDNKARLKNIVSLFVSFFKIGITTFGGGVMMLNNLRRELILKRNWLTEKDMYEYIAIAQATPGVIMVNSATIIGMKKSGLLGSVVSTFAVILPSLIIITGLSFLLNAFDEYKYYVSKFLIGVRVAVCATSISVMLRMIKANIVDVATGIIFAIAFLLSVFLHIQSSVLVILGIISGITIKYFNKKSCKI